MTVAKMEDDTQAETDDATISRSKEDTTSEAEDGRASEDEAGQHQQKEDSNSGMLVLAGEIPEYDPDGDDVRPFDVVAVHGLYGHRENTWTTDGSHTAPGSNWLKDLIYKNYPVSRILTFGYDTSATRGGIYTVGGIREKALQLLNDLVELRNTSSQDIFRPLVFVAHDLGGIIVKEALLIATLEHRKYRDIKDSTQFVIFFGCPHRCTSTQDMEDKVANLLFANQNSRPVGVTRSIKELGRSIIEVNGFFASSNIQTLLSIVNIYSEKEEGGLQILDKYTATLDIAFEERVSCPKPHRDMCKFLEYDDVGRRIERALIRYGSPLRSNDASIEYLQTLRSVAAPIYPLESLYGPGHRFNWITLHESYTKWLDSYGPSILHVHGTAGVSDASEYIFQCLDAYRAVKQDNEIILYFTFNRHDDRCNSVVAMLNTLLAQIIAHNQNLYTAVRLQYEQMSLHRGWTQTELLLCFRNILSYWNHDGILCVINGLDECDGSRKAFLEDICSHASLTERRFKIAITSTTDSDLQTALADWPTIDLDDWPQHSDTANTNPASDIGLEVLKLMQQRPVFCGFEKTITDKLLECKQDKHWHRLVLHQLRLSKSPSTKSAAQREVDLLPSTTPKDLFTRILARVPSERWSWARKALNWILYAFHPLSIRELGVALALEIGSPSDETIDLDELVYQDVAADLDEVFRGMFIVKHNGVYFGHPEAQEFLLAADAEQAHVWYDVKETAHREISNACLLYLSSQQVQYPMAMSNNNNPPADPLESPTFIPRYNLRDYAIKYWSRHYKLIPETFRPTERALEFVQDTKIMHCWAEAYWWSSNSISRTDRVSLSLLPILAGLGLQDLVTEWLDLDGEMPKVSQDRAFALAEAARNAHVQVVRRLLQHNGYSQANLQDALTAGASCCDEAVLDELISYAAESIENFKWPPVVLCRAAQLGLENVVKKLLESGAPTDTTTFTVPDMTPLHYAARQGHAGVVKILLERKASVTVLAAYDRVPLHTAAFYGHATIVKLLLDAGADVNVVDADETNAILLACTQGNYKAVEILAGAGCDMGCDKQGEWTPLLVVANEGFINSARYLLEKAANTEVEGRENWTPLRHAALNSHMELCRLLLDNGAITNTLSGGAPILGESAGNGNLEVVKLLVENGAAVDAVTAEGLTALQKASQNGHLSVVTELLDRGADINHTDDEGETSILLAARYGFAQTVQLLIDRGANLHLATKDDWTPIHISYDHAETTRILMENGADANRLWSFRTPLYLAASWNCIEVVKVLLSFNPNLEIRCLAGNTALTIATTCSHTDIVRLLLEAGANVNHKDETNNSALHYAVSDNREDILRTLMEYHPYLDFRNNDGDTALHCIAYSTSLAIAKLLINGGSDLETRNKECNTPLCQAVMVGNLDIVKYLIAKKAELNIIGGKYGGPLHIACRWLNLELVKLLVEAGADVNLVDPSSAGTPIQSACHCWNLDNWKGAQEHVIRYLINEAKADVATVGGLQGCALNVACGWSTPEMVKLLLENGAKVDVVDEMGRTAVHFAATQTLEHFQPTLDAGADVEQRDAIGRTSLHWAVLSGKIDVVERVLSLSRCLVDQADIDGWTPLLWVAKGCGVEEKQARSNAQVEIIKLLLDRGANPCVRGKGLDQEWSPVKVARYHGADDVVVQLLMAKAKERLAAEGKENSWDEAAHTSEKAFEQMADCDGCLLTLYGIVYQCETCLDFTLCYKCYLSMHLLHANHPFKTSGPEYKPESDKDEDDEDDDDSEDSSSEDDDTDDDGSNDDDDGSKRGPKRVDAKVARKEKKEENADEEDSTEDDKDEED